MLSRGPDRDLRLLVIIPADAVPSKISVDDQTVCGGAVAPCPGSSVLDGRAENRLTVFVSPGRHVFSAQFPQAVGGAHIDEEQSFPFEAAPDVSPQCHVRRGCSVQEPSAEAPPEQPTASSEAECRLNSDCAVGLQCLLGACVPLCREDRDCAKGQECGPGAEGYDECLDVAAPS